MTDKNKPQTQFIPAVHGYFAIEAWADDGDMFRKKIHTTNNEKNIGYSALPIIGFLVRIDNHEDIDFIGRDGVIVYPVGIYGVINSCVSILTPSGLFVDTFSEGVVTDSAGKLEEFASLEQLRSELTGKRN